ncbi:MAG: hypothetical protein GX968_05795 [Tissierellia bacterium]|nr:hypothetical protein [Tissierellia bacterium]
MVLNPFIPNTRANIVIIDGRIDEEIETNLKSLNLNIIPTIQCKEVPEPISYHPDIVMHPINHNTLIIAPNVFHYYEDLLWDMGINLIKGETLLSNSYPKDIAYNVGRIGKYAIHNFKYTDEKLKFYLKKEGFELMHVEQGYTKCSMAIVDEKTIITADHPIYEKTKKLGFSVLLIEPGYIELEGYNYGFIGGSCGNLSKDEIAFSGKFTDHPDKGKILKFLKKHNKKILYLSNKKIKDIGTIISLNCQ